MILLIRRETEQESASELRKTKRKFSKKKRHNKGRKILYLPMKIKKKTKQMYKREILFLLNKTLWMKKSLLFHFNTLTNKTSY